MGGNQTLGQQAADLEGLNEQTAASQARVTTLDQQIAADQAREAPLEAQLRAVARVEYQRPAMDLNTMLQAQDLDQLLSAVAEARLVTKKRQALVDETRRMQQEHVSTRQAEGQQLARLQTLRAAASSAAARLQQAMGSGGSGQAGPPGGELDAATLGPAACPVSGAEETQPFGPSDFEGFHTGIDLAVPTGTPIYAAASGVVGTDLAGAGYGNNVEIQVSDQRMDIYGHMTQFLVMSGQLVQQGQLIGLVGSTGFSSGPHVHYEIRYDGR
ncbi:MAG: peptidoglycan DD-metalloendopeptidase family protein, partial [Nocardiopsaceae bacterium]|nr:peptidoglycan DD-metalloendopeptidase family protein [Nocardiopsaceae bacterium]